jgi:hypothetical protein
LQPLKIASLKVNPWLSFKFLEVLQSSLVKNFLTSELELGGNTGYPKISSGVFRFWPTSISSSGASSTGSGSSKSLAYSPTPEGYLWIEA